MFESGVYERPLPTTGDVVLGRYRIVREVARGGMGVVFEASCAAGGGRVAVKTLHAAFGQDHESIERLSREARLMASLRSRFVPRVVDFRRGCGGGPVMVMELLSGRSLHGELRRGCELPVGRAVSYVVQACAAVAEAHALGIVHRDIKPSNLFLHRSNVPASRGGGTEVSMRVLDFGIAKRERGADAELTRTSETLGTPAYMAPEQLRDSRCVDARADVWALGLVLYRMLAGRLPSEGSWIHAAARTLDDEPMPRLGPEIAPPGLADVVARALEKDPDRRYPDARALGVALAPFAADTPMTRLALEELAELGAWNDDDASDAPSDDLADEANEIAVGRSSLLAWIERTATPAVGALAFAAASVAMVLALRGS